MNRCLTVSESAGPLRGACAAVRTRAASNGSAGLRMPHRPLSRVIGPSTSWASTTGPSPQGAPGSLHGAPRSGLDPRPHSGSCSRPGGTVAPHAGPHVARLPT
jgi:hypothetical protein